MKLPDSERYDNLVLHERILRCLETQIELELKRHAQILSLIRGAIWINIISLVIISIIIGLIT